MCRTRLLIISLLLFSYIGAEAQSASCLEPDRFPFPMKDRYATALIGPAGGKVTLYGVSLEIPPGALLGETNIKLGIICEKHHRPHLDVKQALLSPIVSCEPHGLLLETPAKLVLPHCALAEGVANIEEAWEFTILKSQNPLHEEDNWLETTTDDCTGLEIRDKDICLNLKHFSWWALFGTIRDAVYGKPSKKVKLVACTPTRNQPKRVFKISVPASISAWVTS